MVNYLPETLTAEWLDKNGVAPSEIYHFTRAFPQGMRLTREHAEKALREKLDLVYIFETILRFGDKEEFSVKTAEAQERKEQAEKRIQRAFQDANLDAQKIRNTASRPLEPLPPSLETAYRSAMARDEVAQVNALFEAEQTFNEAITDAVMEAIAK